MAKLIYFLFLLVLTVNIVSAEASPANNEPGSSKAVKYQSSIKMTIKKISSISDLFISNLLLISQTYKALSSAKNVSYSGDGDEKNNDSDFNRNNYSTENYDSDSNILSITNYEFVYQTNSVGSKSWMVQNKYYSVQIGSFKKFDNALNYYNQLRRKHYPVYMQYTDFHHKSFVRVKIGKYSSFHEASAMRNKLRKAGYKQAIIKR